MDWMNKVSNRDLSTARLVDNVVDALAAAEAVLSGRGQ